jgi:hypothetical protein
LLDAVVHRPSTKPASFGKNAEPPHEAVGVRVNGQYRHAERVQEDAARALDVKSGQSAKFPFCIVPTHAF